MRQAYFGPSLAAIHVEAGSMRGQDKHHRSRTKGNSLMPVKEERQALWQRKWNGKASTKRGKKPNRDAGSKSKSGLQEFS
jgi:hypothetical protein